MAQREGNGERPPAFRASDAEREHVVALLEEQCTVGRLTLEELGERVESTYRAVTRDELTAITADLPAAPLPPRPPAQAPGAPLFPGRGAFSERVEVPRARGRVLAEALARLAPPLHRHGYEVAAYSPQGITFVQEKRPAWTIVVAIFGFPIGLVALAYKQRSQIVVTLEDGPAGGTAITAYGVAPLSVRRAFAELRA